MPSTPQLYRQASYLGVGLKIEGVGPAAGQYRFFSGAAPALDSSSLYLAALDAWPSSVGGSVDHQAGTSTVQGASFALRRTSQVLDHLWRANPPLVAQLVSGLGSSTTTVVLDTSGLSGVVHLGREAIKLGTNTTGGTYTGCTRGYLGTQALRHGDPANYDPEVYAYLPPGTRKGRVVTFFRLASTATSYSDEETLWTGVLDELQLRGVRAELQCSSALALIGRALLMTRQARWTIPGGRVSRRPDAGYGALGDSTNNCLVASVDSGRVMRVPYVPGASSAQGSGYRLNLGGRSQVGDLPLPEELEGEFVEVLSSNAQQPSSSASPDTFTLPLSDEPHVAVLQLLTTQANDGTPSGNGSYDTGINNLAGAIPQTLIDVAQIETWGAQQRARLDNLWLGLEGKPEQLADVVRRILHPLGATLTQGLAGKIRVAPLDHIGGYGEAVEIVQAEVLSVGPQLDAQVGRILGSVVVVYGLLPGVGTSKTTVIDAYARRRTPPGERSTLEVDARYYRGQGEVSARSLAIRVAATYRTPPPVVELDVLDSVNVDVGDPVRVTHALLPARGALGWTRERCLCVGAERHFEGDLRGGAGQTFKRLTLLHVQEGYHARQGYIAPAGIVSAWSAALKRLTLSSNGLGSAANPFFSTDAGAFSPGDVVQLCDQYGTLREGGLVIASRTGNNITLQALPSVTPVAGDVLRLAPYTDATTDAKALWAWVADSSNEVGGSTANSNAYTG